MTIQTNKHQFIDPVCRMNVAKSSTVPSFSYRDDIYYFCANCMSGSVHVRPRQVFRGGNTQEKREYGEGMLRDFRTKSSWQG